MTPKRIVSAATKLRDGRIIMSVRHLDNTFFQALAIDTKIPPSQAHIEMIRGHVDGFVDSERNFLTREEAWPVALGAGQIIPAEMGWQTGRLHSEHLY